MTARSDDVKVRDAEITRQHGIIQRLDAEVEELRAENERLRRVHEADAAGLNRWCNYQDRLFAVMTSDEIRAFEKRLDEGGWVNEPLCVHVDSRERAIRWAVTLEGQEARLRAALQRIHDQHGRNKWHPDTTYATEAARSWHDGHISAMAHVSLIAFEALDPEGWAEHENDMEASRGTDEDWWKRTGHCGKCAVVASSCECEGECGCWELHGPPLEPYKTPETLRAENARLRAELEALRQPALFGAALTGSTE